MVRRCTSALVPGLRPSQRKARNGPPPPAGGGQGAAGARDTSLFIMPGYRFRIIDALITNFHLPKSTLVMLVSALAGRERILEAYRHAVEEKYRFFSYGDACFIENARLAG